MTEYKHIIFLSVFLPQANLTKEYTGKMDKNNEFLFKNKRISEIFSDVLVWTDNNNASSTSSMDSKDSEMGILDNNEILDKNEIIDHLEQTKFTPYVIIDFIDGKF